MFCIFTSPSSPLTSPLLSALYLSAKLEEGIPLPLPRDTYLNSLEFQIHEVSEKWVSELGSLDLLGYFL